MSTVALAIGLVVGNIIHPGAGLHLDAGVARPAGQGGRRDTTADFLLGIIPDTLVSGADLRRGAAGPARGAARRFRGAGDGPAGRTGPARHRHLQRLVFRILAMIMWAGADRRVRRDRRGGRRDRRGRAEEPRRDHARLLHHLRAVRLRHPRRCCCGWSPVNIFKLLRYLGREFLLIVSTSSSESALPRLIAKMEHFGVSKPVVGITVPTGYSFNLDGTAIYLTMASLFIADGAWATRCRSASRSRCWSS